MTQLLIRAEIEGAEFRNGKMMRRYIKEGYDNGVFILLEEWREVK